MTLIKCPECTKGISDKALACPHCGNPIKEKNKVLVQIDTAPENRRKYRKRHIIFSIMIFAGLIFGISNIIAGRGGVGALFIIVFLVGLVGGIHNAVANWLNRP